MKSQNKMYM